MFELYAQPRPGRPRWALLASAALLLLTVALAFAVIGFKTRGQLVALGESTLFPRGEFRCRLPVGWQPRSSDELPPGIIAAVSEPGQEDRPARQLILFRGFPRPLGVPSRDADAALKVVVRSVVPGPLQPFGPGAPARVGILPGWSAEFLALNPFVRGKGMTLLGRAAIAPQGQVVGLVLLAAGHIGGADRQLVSDVADSLELLGVAQASDPAAVMNAAGIRFDPPRGARCYAKSLPRLACVSMSGGDGPTLWLLDLYRVPILGQRTPEALVTDFALSTLARADLPQAVQTPRVGSREYAQVAIAISSTGPPVLAACVAIDTQTALLMVGRAEQDGVATLDELCHRIARAATVAPYEQLVDLPRARQAARDLLAQIARQGLSAEWNAYAGQQLQYAISAPGLPMGEEVLLYKATRQDDTPWWTVTAQSKFQLGGLVLRESIERWSVSDDARAHQYRLEIVDPEGGSEYLERRDPGSTQVRRELAIRRSEVRKITTAVDDTYACEPVIIDAASRMARTPDAPPAAFTTTETFTQGVACWVLVPLGKRPLPGRPGHTASAVQLQRDFDPAPILLYFDDAGMLLALAQDSGTWRGLQGSTGGQSD